MAGGHAPRQEPVDEKSARPEDENQQHGKPVVVGAGGLELVGVGEHGKECVLFRGQEGHRHVDEQHQGDQAGGKSDEEERAAAEFHQPDEDRGGVGRGKAQGGEVIRDLVDVGEFAPSVLAELPSPVKANGKQTAGFGGDSEWRLRAHRRRARRRMIASWFPLSFR